MQSLELDHAELERLIGLCQRDSVKILLNVDLNGVKNKIENLKRARVINQEKKPSQPKGAYDVQLKNYCKMLDKKKIMAYCY